MSYHYVKALYDTGCKVAANTTPSGVSAAALADAQAGRTVTTPQSEAAGEALDAASSLSSMLRVSILLILPMFRYTLYTK